MLRWSHIALLAAGVLALAACDVPQESKPLVQQPAPQATSPTPPQREARAPSIPSKELSTYYKRVQNDLLVQGLLRTDGGGPDTPYTAAMLARNFEQIAFFDEYAQGGFAASNGRPGTLKRWRSPVRFGIEFGPGVTPSQQTRDTNSVYAFARRLGQATGHPIGVSRSSSANFHVLFMGEDDAELIRARVNALVPGVSPAALRLFTGLPREIHCLVVAFSEAPGASSYGTAIALVRAEHPDLMRQSCIQEELAQGLGLANDSPAARPSIFNDDDEFAYLTSHDTHLLGMLYDARLRTGMSLPAARPIIRQMAQERLGAGS